MSSATVDHPVKMGIINKKENENKIRKVVNAPHKKHKHEENRHFKFGRKRLQSFTNNAKFFPPHKRRKKDGIIPPTKFLLGGNICDPLNLNSMQDEEVNRALNAVTPKSSPLPTPKHRKGTIEVIIPPNINDPLNLSNCNDDAEYEKQLISPVKKNTKKRNKNRKRKKPCNLDEEDKNKTTEVEDAISKDQTEVVETNTNEVSEEPEKVESPVKVPSQEPQQLNTDTHQKEKVKLRLKPFDEQKDKRIRKLDTKDKIVSPVIPQPGAWKPRLQHRPNADKKKKTQCQSMPSFNNKNARFQYGNYNRYYGYRNPHHEIDPRLTIFSQRKEFFYGKDVLDIGCNIGHITLTVASDFGARSVTGIDIDKKLIQIARKNIKHYVNCYQSPAVAEDGTRKEVDASFFPISMVINYGPIDIPGFTKHDYKGFPYNVTFVQGNYVLEDDALLSSEQPQFDTILCLSITKWIHLNFGDAGLKQSFRRMFAQLKPGGILILEPQSWSSYKKKKTLTEKIFRNYHSIEFYPHKFTSYLLTEVGFRSYETISVPHHHAKGFQRSILLFKKAGLVSPVATTTVTATATSTSTSAEATVSEEVPRKKIKLSHEQSEYEYERDLFPTEIRDAGSLSGTSQRSGESFTQYEHLANIYAPSATPCYEQTPVHCVESNGLPDPEKMCYLDVKIEHGDANDEDIKTSEDIPKQRPEESENSTVQVNTQPLKLEEGEKNEQVEPSEDKPQQQQRLKDENSESQISNRPQRPENGQKIDRLNNECQQKVVNDEHKEQITEAQVDQQQQKKSEETERIQQLKTQVDNT